MRLVRSCFEDYGAQNVWIRDTADVLSRARDSAVMPKTHSLVAAELGGQSDDRALAEMLLAMQHGSNLRPLSSGDLTVELEGVRERLLAARQTVPDWSLDETGFEAVRCGLHKTYARSQRAMIKVVENFRPARCHEWRKRVKYHGHHMRLLREIWPSEMSAREEAADRLGDLLGALHDLDVYRTALGTTLGLTEAEHWGLPLSVSAGRLEAGLFAECEPLGKMLFGAVPDDFVGQIGARWESCSEAAETPAPGRSSR